MLQILILIVKIITNEIALSFKSRSDSIDEAAYVIIVELEYKLQEIKLRA